MSRSLFWLSDEGWAAIAPHLPQNQPGARRVDDRWAISGIIHMQTCGGRWADVPPEHGPPTIACNRWNRWSRRGIWTRILAALTEEGWIAEAAQIDSSTIKVHRCAGGAVRGISKASGGRLAPRTGVERTPSASLGAVGQPGSQKRFWRSWMSSGGRSASS